MDCKPQPAARIEWCHQAFCDRKVLWDVGDLGLGDRFWWMKTGEYCLTVLFSINVISKVEVKLGYCSFDEQLVLYQHMRSFVQAGFAQDEKTMNEHVRNAVVILHPCWGGLLIWYVYSRGHRVMASNQTDFSVSLKLLLHISWMHAYCLRSYLPVCQQLCSSW